MRIWDEEGCFLKGDGAPDEKSPLVRHDRHGLDPVRGIMVSRNDDHRRIRFSRDPGQERIELTDGRFRRHRAIENVTRNHEDIGLGADEGPCDLFENGRLILVERNPVELATEMEIGGVEDLHDKTI